MRADRLIATLLLLQTHGRLTAGQIAEELEVSVRTSRRDLEALSMAGVPVYPQPGRGGGWSLVGGSRTDLTGLLASEVRAVFIAAAGTLGHAPELSPALRKLLAATPESLRPEALAAVGSVMVDETDWGDIRTTDRTTHHDTLQQAVIDRAETELTYDTPGKGRSTRTVEPLGMVAKAGNWYLVAGTESGQRTFRLDRVAGARLTGGRFERRSDFDLAAAWREITVSYRDRLATVEVVTVETDPWATRVIASIPGLRLSTPEGLASGRTRIELTGASVHSVVKQIAGLVGGLEIISPPEARDESARIGLSLLNRYGDDPPAPRRPV